MAKANDEVRPFKAVTDVVYQAPQFSQLATTHIEHLHRRFRSFRGLPHLHNCAHFYLLDALYHHCDNRAYMTIAEIVARVYSDTKIPWLFTRRNFEYSMNVFRWTSR